MTQHFYSILFLFSNIHQYADVIVGGIEGQPVEYVKTNITKDIPTTLLVVFYEFRQYFACTLANLIQV